MGFIKMPQLPAEQIDHLIGKRIQAKRKDRGYSAERLSELLDISQQQLSRYERGVNKINVAHLVAIANFLETPISYFFLDCMNSGVWNDDIVYDSFNELNFEQKDALINFLVTMKRRQIKII